jgi:UPF0716 protein FxsA
VLPLLALLFVALPLVELMLLLRVGDLIGPLYTLGLVVCTGVVGASLARWQGMRVLASLRAETAAGRLPTGPILEGVLLLVAGAFLITPGVITDVAGFLLIIPPSRRVVVAGLRRWGRDRFQVVDGGPLGGGPLGGGPLGGGPFSAPPAWGPGGGTIDVEAEIRDVEPAPTGTDPSSERPRASDHQA